MSGKVSIAWRRLCCSRLVYGRTMARRGSTRVILFTMQGMVTRFEWINPHPIFTRMCRTTTVRLRTGCWSAEVR